ncbi:response regulator [Sinorhizobium sp. RAC02]|uniref:response regulator n=1 Tax=Sinorhizobium sp. RAC02 TaxID=1842534 RepID=UPI00083E1860|nr:response regulator [Sinorhizobium sp. RAC02]AOF93226.1 response regulator [Sinorhizobium sp. RAC02]
MTSESPYVLIAEDEFLIRMSVVEDMRDADFHVFEASNAVEALALLEAHPEIDTLFTDIDMPGSMDGLALAKAVRELRPDVMILLTSGYLRVALNDLPDQFPFFSKPYEIGRVINHIRGHLTQ